MSSNPYTNATSSLGRFVTPTMLLICSCLFIGCSSSEAQQNAPGGGTSQAPAQRERISPSEPEFSTVHVARYVYLVHAYDYMLPLPQSLVGIDEHGNVTAHPPSIVPTCLDEITGDEVPCNKQEVTIDLYEDGSFDIQTRIVHEALPEDLVETFRLYADGTVQSIAREDAPRVRRSVEESQSTRKLRLVHPRFVMLSLGEGPYAVEDAPSLDYFRSMGEGLSQSFGHADERELRVDLIEWANQSMLLPRSLSLAITTNNQLRERIEWVLIEE